MQQAGKRAISRRHEIRFLLLLAIGFSVPTLGTVIAILATAQPDISDLTPAFRTVGEYRVVNWPEMERGRPNVLQEGSPAFTGARVQALGYLTPNSCIRRGVAAGSVQLCRYTHGGRFGVLLAASGILTPLLAAIVHVSSELAFILNSARLVPVSGVLRNR
jgi:hypothetical protein